MTEPFIARNGYTFSKKAGNEPIPAFLFSVYSQIYFLYSVSFPKFVPLIFDGH